MQSINPVFCLKCRAPLDASDAFCKQCGADQRQPHPPPVPDPTVAMAPAAAQALPAARSRSGATYLVPFLVALLACVGLGALLVRDSARRRGGQAQGDGLPAVMTARQLRAAPLQFNGRRVCVRDTIVDSSQLSLRIGGSLQDYSRTLIFGNPSEVSVEVVPRAPGMEINDIVEVKGLYDAESNTLHITEARKVGRAPVGG